MKQLVGMRKQLPVVWPPRLAFVVVDHGSIALQCSREVVVRKSMRIAKLHPRQRFGVLWTYVCYVWMRYIEVAKSKASVDRCPAANLAPHMIGTRLNHAEREGVFRQYQDHVSTAYFSWFSEHFCNGTDMKRVLTTEPSRVIVIPLGRLDEYAIELGSESVRHSSAYAFHDEPTASR
ncbi:MAG: hypothetical protein AB7R40_26585 [Nitrospiraceae bacterium]